MKAFRVAKHVKCKVALGRLSEYHTKAISCESSSGKAFRVALLRLYTIEKPWEGFQISPSKAVK